MTTPPATPYFPEVASPEGRRLFPLPAQHVVMPMHLPLTVEQMVNVRLGFVPENMGDRWFIYVDADDVAHIHRASTGFCTYQVQVARTDDGWAAVQLRASRNSAQYSETDDATDLASATRLVRFYLMIQRKAPTPWLVPVSDEMRNKLVR